MGSTTEFQNLHPLEKQMAEAMASGRELHVEDLGGIYALQEAAPEIGISPLMPEFLNLLLESSQTDKKEAVDNCLGLAVNFVDHTKDPLIMNEVVKVVHEWLPLSEKWEDRFFYSFIVLSFDYNSESLTRAFALDGAFRLVGDNLQRRYALLAKLVAVQDNDDREFLRHAAKIMGMAYSLWRSEGITERLEAIVQIEKVKDEAAFELGIAALMEGLDSTEIETIKSKFKCARNWFELAIRMRGHRPDAELFSAALQAMEAFSGEATAKAISDLSLRISETAFTVKAWRSDSYTPPWLGGRFAEMASWQLLSLRLSNFASSLEEPSWLDPVAVIEQELISIIAVSRSLFRRKRDSGLEVFIRPKIMESLRRERGQVHLLKKWLAKNPNHTYSSAIDTLLPEAECDGKPNCISGRVEGETVVAIGPTDQIKKKQTSAFEYAREALNDFQLESSSPHFEKIMFDCQEALSQIKDYEVLDVKIVFNAIFLLTLRYLESRMDLTKRNAPYIDFLFEPRNNEPLPKEDRLQNDFFNFLIGTIGLGNVLQIERSDISSGRTDVSISYKKFRLIIEVKREASNASFEALCAAYSGQVMEYQNTNICLGFLLVLDLTDKKYGVDHLTDQIRAFAIQRPNESSKRGVVVVRVPGNRLTPSHINSY